MNRTFTLCLTLLGIALIIGSVVYLKGNEMDTESHEEMVSHMGFYLISGDIIQLEGAIMFQMDHQWSEPNSVVEKVEDVIESIGHTILLAKSLGELSEEDEAVLVRLSDHFEKMPEYSGFPQHELNAAEKTMFEELRAKLRNVGWGMNISYSGKWDEVIQKANHLMEIWRKPIAEIQSRDGV